jgi:hypothetical protein
MKSFIAKCLPLLATAFLLTSIPAEKASCAEILIGSAVADITPDKPVALNGQWGLRVSTKAETPIIATVLTLQGSDNENKQDQAVLVSCDLTGVTPEILQKVRDAVRPQLPNLDVNKIILNATHTHTAPVLEEGVYGIPKEGVMQPTEYVAFLVDRVSDAIVRAWKGSQPGQVAWGLGHAVVGQNRRAVYANGSAVMYGDTSRPDFRRFEGYEDHGVEVLFFWNAQKELQAVAVSLACTTQEVEGLSVVNADFWHQARNKLKERFGANLNVLPWVSAAGDQSPHLMYRKAAEERMRQLRGASRCDDIARNIAAAVEEAYEGAAKEIHGDVPFRHVVETMKLPARKLSEEDVEVAKKAIAEAEQRADKTSAHKAWYSHVLERYEQQKTNPFSDTEIHVLRLGDIAICTNPFELYLDYGVQMKAKSKALQTFIIQLAAGPASYLPTQTAVQGGGYSAEPFSNAVGPEGGQMLTDHTLELMNAMWAESKTSDK